ncbi:NERD domain-containing protein [Plebeiibacterium sediminum]|uniref:NERD domain-containing protein n=1 Tax=Plebeiibacterium sediminum TaxID=2992112 RepID=A0AAE3SHV3_9BACT|nr:NERD domain-containing protein [Plebeiobacterium sediminum]MCW3788508.1 NERD domain-containing protein [Plebeiobacterium sediminum]
MNKTKLKEALAALEGNSFSDVEYLFLKVNTPFKDKKVSDTFYKSDFASNFVKDLSQTDLWDEILYYYFSRGVNASTRFLEAVVGIDFKSAQGFILLYESYKYSYHWDTFESFKSSRDIKLKQFYRELEFLKNNKEYWDAQDNLHQEEILKFSCEDIIIQAISFFQKFKNYSPQNINDNSKIISYRLNLIHILNKFINAKRKDNSNNNLHSQPKYCIKTFSEILNQELPPLRTKEYFENNFDPKFLPKENVSDIKEQIRGIINFQFAKAENENIVNSILTGNAHFEMIDGNEAEILTNKSYMDYQTSLKKDKYNEHYLINKVIRGNIDELKGKGNDENDMWRREYIIKKYSSLEYFKFFNIPFAFKPESTESKVDFEKAILLLQVFAANLFPQGRFFGIQNKKVDYVFKRQLETEFKNVFSKRRQIDYVSVFEENELINNCIQYFQWSKDDVTGIINYLTIDLNLKNGQLINIEDTPFIKIGDLYFWLSALNKDLKWEVVLHRRFVRDEILAHNKQTEDTERDIAVLFENAGFESKPSYKYNYTIDNKTRISGDIDTLAYKEKTIFIVEVKNTYVEENPKRDHKYVLENFKIHAVNQLKKGEKYIRDNFPEIKKELKIDCSLDELNIQPLIVSNVYVGDENIFYEKYLKLSLFELTIILRDDLYSMRTTQMFKTLLEINEFEGFNIDNVSHHNPSGVPEPGQDRILKKEDLKLWKNDNNCSPFDIISAIKKNKIWKHLEFDNIVYSYSLGEYNSEADYLA